MKVDVIEKIIYENSAQKVGDLLIQLVTKHHCSFAEVYRYSHFDNLVEVFLEINSKKEITKPLDRIDSLISMPLLYIGVKECQPLFVNERMLATSIPPKYKLPPSTKCVAVLPIHKRQVLVGMISVHFDFELSEQQQMDLIRFVDYMSDQIVAPHKMGQLQGNINEKELKTLQFIAEGWTTLEIAEYMKVSEATVKHYIKTFMRKSNTYNRAHAVGYYMKHFYC